MLSIQLIFPAFAVAFAAERSVRSGLPVDMSELTVELQEEVVLS
jgi:hypothetical protein